MLEGMVTRGVDRKCDLEALDLTFTPVNRSAIQVDGETGNKIVESLEQAVNEGQEVKEDFISLQSSYLWKDKGKIGPKKTIYE